MENELKIAELVNTDQLQHMQDILADLTGMGVMCAENDGKLITNGSNKPLFCKYIAESKIGRALCMQCGLYGAEKTNECGSAKPFLCHCGLVEFASPIKVEEEVVGTLIGGLVAKRPMREELVREEAERFGIDPDALWEAAQEIKVIPREKIDRACEYLDMQAQVLSGMVYGKYLSKRATVQIESNSNVKSDFLANMSHEIRTPMNAVIGMAEMALREEMSHAARDYIGQIKSSGKALLNIINDILDFSKIESGKMELSCVDYEPLSLINDVSLIVMTRLTDKPVELLLDVDPDIPHTLHGDDLRIRQILINLANNATKFTNKGHVMLKVRYENIDEETIRLIIAVIDTGIGIRKEDLGKLFSSFQQVDSKRNRNVEGTGLGLAITKNLITLMNGSIHIDSEYEVGSTFTISIPQKIVDKSPSIRLKNPEKYALAGFFSRDDVAEDFVSDSKKLNVYVDDLSGATDWEASISAWLQMHKNRDTYIVVDEKMMENGFAEYFANHVDSAAGALLLAESFSDVKKWNDMPYLQIIKKPFSVLNLAGFLEEDSCKFGGANNTAESEFHFIAPKARVLVVDDNAINLSVAEGLLEPLKMQVDTALSGKDALSLIDSNKYDIIFMDHMMPEMDGIETTRIIRRLHPECNSVPIIALTANAISGTKELFLSEGMNDFVAKPIEVRILINKVHQWLPAEKIMQMSAEQLKEQGQAAADSSEETKAQGIPDTIGDLDVKSAYGLLGTQKLFWKVLKDYYRVITAKADLIERYYQENDWTNYVVEVHALKSASKQIGAEVLSKIAAEMEAAGNARNIDLIQKRTSEMITKYRSYIPVLAPFCVEKEAQTEKEIISEELLAELLTRMLEAVDNLDVVEMGAVTEQMEQYSFPDDQNELFEKLKNAVADIDVDTCEELSRDWMAAIQGNA